MKDDAEFVLSDEALVSEIAIAPDGRVFVFGLSKQVLEILATIDPSDSNIQARLAACNVPTVPASEVPCHDE